MKKGLFVSLLCVVMVLTFTMAAYQSTLATSVGMENKSGYKAGTYTGKGTGREGDVVVKVTLQRIRLHR